MSRFYKILIYWFLTSQFIIMLVIQSGYASDQVSDKTFGPAHERFFVGEQTCRRCHHDPKSGNQFNIWRLSSHSKAHASLVMHESNEMAQLSGISGNVFEEPICLGCHTTASDAETWQKDNTFFIEDGIQCEFCHGPGSDYADKNIMSDKSASKRAGLLKPDQDSCMVCHKNKGSHQAVIQTEKFDYESALKKISHKIPEGYLSEVSKSDQISGNPTIKRLDPDNTGVMVCSSCHGKESDWDVFSRWRRTPHADAYSVLGSEKGWDMAEKKGLQGNPQESETCLTCHALTHGMESNISTGLNDLVQGVQCENCHGPGKNYALEKIMKKAQSAHQKGLIKPDEKTCRNCHNGYHGKTFDYSTSILRITHKKTDIQAAGNKTHEYKTPANLILSNDGKTLIAACEASDSVIILDTDKRIVTSEIEVMNLPNGVCLSPDEKTLYVSNRGSDTISVIDMQSLTVSGVLIVGDEPHDLVTDQLGETLYVANTGSHDISVVDLKSGLETKRLSGGRGTWGMSRSPDNRFIFVTNNLSHFVKTRKSSLSEVTVINTENARVSNRIMLPDANLIQGIDYSPDGEFALVTLIRTKNLVPMVRVMQGWMITNGIGVLWKDGRVDQLLLDEVDHYFADPTDLVITPNSRYAFITGGGVNEVAVVDIEKLKTTLGEATQEERDKIFPNHLGVSSQYIHKRIPVGSGPRGLVVSSDGKFVYTADALDDTISVIDVKTMERVGVINLGGPEEITQERAGERIFHSADITYGKQFSCHTCHPDGGIDGLSYDISPDGLGLNPVDNRTLRGVLDTAPFKWTGKNPSLSRQCGPRLAVFFTRLNPFTPDQVKNLDRYICTIPRNPNRYLKKGELTPPQQRGKILFKRTHANSGELIPVKDRCDTCHAGPYFTNRKVTDVGTRSEIDTHGKFDVPHLNNIYETAPYLHDGSANTLEEIWTRFNPEDKHGVTNDMTKDQLNDLIEYLKIL